MFFEEKCYGTRFELTLLRISALFERIPLSTASVA